MELSTPLVKKIKSSHIAGQWLETILALYDDPGRPWREKGETRDFPPHKYAAAALHILYGGDIETSAQLGKLVGTSSVVVRKWRGEKRFQDEVGAMQKEFSSYVSDKFTNSDPFAERLSGEFSLYAGEGQEKILGLIRDKFIKHREGLAEQKDSELRQVNWWDRCYRPFLIFVMSSDQTQQRAHKELKDSLSELARWYIKLADERIFETGSTDFKPLGRLEEITNELIEMGFEDGN